MKKFIISLIILIIFAIGIGIWGLIIIPIDTYGVIHTTLWGFDEKLLKPGHYYWKWEKLLPTVLTLYRFELNNFEPFKKNLENPIKGYIFPSAKFYEKVFEGDYDFYFEIKLYIEFSLIPNSLPYLVNEGLRPDNLQDWYNKKANELTRSISNIILNDPELLYKPDALKQIVQLVEKDKMYSSIDIQELRPISIRIPDYKLYENTRENYINYSNVKYEKTIEELRNEIMSIELIREQLSNEIEALSLENKRNNIALEKEMDIINNLENYGELFSKYPVLINFLYLRKLDNDNLLKLSQLFSTENLNIRK